jgi:hypothetical protein
MRFSWTNNEHSWQLHAGDHWSMIGFIERVPPGDYNACDMSQMQWVWRRFNNVEDAQAWLMVCVRMNQ